MVAAIDEVLAKVQADGITDEEVKLAQTTWEASFFRGMQTISRKGNQLNQYYIHTGDTDYIAKDLARFLNVTAEGVHNAAKNLGDGRLVLHIGPQGTEESDQ